MRLKKIIIAMAISATTSSAVGCDSSPVSTVSGDVKLSVTRLESGDKDSSKGVLITAIPIGKHIFSSQPQTIGRPTSLEGKISGSPVEVKVLYWPKPRTLRNEILDSSFTAYQDTIRIPFELAKVSGQATLTLKYILCDDQCVPGESSVSFDLAGQ